MLVKYLFRRDFYSFIQTLLGASYTQYRYMQELKKSAPGLIADPDIKLVSPERLQLGKNVKLNKGVYINCGSHPTEGDQGRIVLGNNVILGVYMVLYSGRGTIEIGDYCDLGSGVKIIPHSIDVAYDHTITPRHIIEKVKLGRGTLVGSGSIIHGGTELGEFCNVVAGSVVQGKYPAYTTLVGNPARAIPRREFIKDENFPLP